MGHSESFYFVDPRDGEYGVAYHRSTREDAERLAMAAGCGGGVQVQITAYPPKPSSAVLARNIDSESEDSIPF